MFCAIATSDMEYPCWISSREKTGMSGQPSNPKDLHGLNMTNSYLERAGCIEKSIINIEYVPD